ncbi:MAG TPA: hypothetical protein VLV16_08525 [Gemmatimonadales bacterium]|nr:hypothetical protein [Gemmatimonadales bacterium]
MKHLWHAGGLAVALVTGVTAGAHAQGTEPLRKTDVIRLIASPLIGKGEVADLIRRNCLSFLPTERDWADFRRVGADPDILGSIGACAGHRRASAGGAVEPLRVAPLPARAVASPGTVADARVLLTRGERVQAGVALVLRGTAQAGGGKGPDAEAMTDERGLALFRFPVGRTTGRYTLRVALKDGTELTGQPGIELVVGAGAPAQAQVQPPRLDLDSGDELAVSVAVTDSFGNPVAAEPVELRAEDPAMGFGPATRATDSLGRAIFAIRPGAVRGSGKLRVSVRGNVVASLDAVFTEPAAEAGSGFLPLTQQVGTAGAPLDAPLVFQVRGSSGRALPGRVVVFRAYNAQVEPDRVITDATGLARLQVTLGSRAGTAVVTAAVDSVQRQATLRVTAGAATEVILEQNSVRVDGGHLFVTADTTFVLRISAKDAHGNPAPIGALARALEQMRGRFNASSRLLRILSVQSDEWASQVTFRPLSRGSAPLTLADATVTVDVVARGGVPR